MTEQELQKQREDADKLAKKSLATHFARKAAHHEKCESCEANKAEHHAGMAEIHKAHHASFKALHKADVGTEEPHATIHEAVNLHAEFHKAAHEHHTKMAKAHAVHEKAHKAMAGHYHKMSESADSEEHAKTVTAIKAEIAAEPAVTVPTVTKTTPTLLQDVDAAAAAARDSQEYKDAVKAIAKEKVDKEIEELRKTTLAPDGVRLIPADGKNVGTGTKAVSRDNKTDEFELVGAGVNVSTAGL